MSLAGLTLCVFLCLHTPGARHTQRLPGSLSKNPSNQDVRAASGYSVQLFRKLRDPTVRDRPLVVGKKTAACVSICTCIYSVCSRLPVSVSLPSQPARLNTVCCLKETDLMANDI